MTAFMTLMMLPTTVLADSAAQLVTQISAIPGLIATADGTVVKVTGTATAVSTPLSLDIDTGLTVEWGAFYQGSVDGTASLINLGGDGVFAVVAGGLLENMNSGYTIDATDENASIIVNNGHVAAYSGTAIRMTGRNATVVVRGGGSVTTNATSNTQSAIDMSSASNTGLNVTVMNNAKVAVLANNGNGYAIQTYGNVQINGNATVGAYGSGGGCAIKAQGSSSKITVSGGTVWSNVGVAIHTNQAGSSVTVSGGEVYSRITGNNQGVIFMENGGVVTITGSAKIKALADGGVAIQTSSSVVDIAGNAQVSATTGYAINATDNSVINVKSGFVFAYGTDISGGDATNSVVNQSAALSVTDDGFVVAWNYNEWNYNGRLPYYFTTSDHLLILKEGNRIATAVWGKSGSAYGIIYQTDGNVGFFPLSVTVTEYIPEPDEGMALINDVTIEGNVDEELPATQSALITLYGDLLTKDRLQEENAASWFTSGLPAGVTVVAERVEDVFIRLIFSGIPTEESNAVFHIDIPGDILMSRRTTTVEYNPNAKFNIYVREPDVGMALIDDITVEGNVGEELPVAQSVIITLYGDLLTKDRLQEENAASWFTSGLPAGVTVVAERVDYVFIRLTFSGVPTETSNALFQIDIPGDILMSRRTTTVEYNPDAKFNIEESSVDDTDTGDVNPSHDDPVNDNPVDNDPGNSTPNDQDIVDIITTYSVTVINGTGTSVYKKDDIVTIKADQTSSLQQFIRWEITPSVTFVHGFSHTSPMVEFIMPADYVTAKAIYEEVSNDIIPTNNNIHPQAIAIKAFVQSGMLYVSGVVQGATLRVYNITGAMIVSTAFAEGREFVFPLPGRGVYMVTDGKETVKVVY